MSQSRRVIYYPNKGGFLTAHIVGEPYGEMEPTFIDEIIDHLGENLVLMDRQNRRMSVKWNGLVEHPLIVEGWNEVRDFFDIQGNKLMLMNYIGQNRFIIDVQPQEIQARSLPSYHSYKYYFNDPISFDVTLTKYMATKSQLTLKSDFAYYVRRTGYKFVNLYGPYGDEIPSKVLTRKRGSSYSVKLGTEWMEFVDLNGFVEGDTLNFKFVNQEESNIMKVIKKN